MSLSKVINFMIKLSTERQHIRRILRKNKKYLVSGNYYIVGGSKRIAFRKSNRSFNFIENNNLHVIRTSKTKDSLLKKMFKYILYKFSVIKIINNCRKPNYLGEVVMFTRTNDFKIFSFDEHKVMTFMKDNENYLKIKDTVNAFKGKFPITIIDFYDLEQAIIEEYIDFKPYRDWSSQERTNVLNYIFMNYEDYFKQISNPDYVCTENLINKFLGEVGTNDLIGNIQKILASSDRLINWPILRLHGDLGFNNILLSSNKIFFIDWEDSKEHIFFYDLLNVFLFEYIFHNDKSYLEKYVNGFYDDKLYILFEAMNIEFCSRKKINYFAVFLLERVISEKCINYPHLPTMIKLCQSTLLELTQLL